METKAVAQSSTCFQCSVILGAAGNSIIPPSTAFAAYSKRSLWKLVLRPQIGGQPKYNSIKQVGVLRQLDGVGFMVEDKRLWLQRRALGVRERDSGEV